MTRPTSNNRNSQRGGRSRQIPIGTSSRLNSNRRESPTAPERSDTTRPHRPSSLPPTNRIAHSTRETSEDNKDLMENPETEAYPNAYEDPDPISPDLTADAQEAQRKMITAFDDEMYAVISFENSSGEELWIDFISTFRPNSLKTWPKGLTFKWLQLLRSRGIHVDSGRGISRVDALTRLRFRKTHVAASSPTMQGITPSPGPHLVQSQEEIREKEYKPTGKGPTPTPIDIGSRSPTCPGSITTPHHLQYAKDTEMDSEADKSSDELDSETEYPRGNVIVVKQCIDTIPARNEMSTANCNSSQPPRTIYGSGLGIQGLMRSFVRQKAFTGSWKEDLDSTISVYETMATMCEVTDDEKLRAIPIMLSGDALVYNSSHVKHCKTYEDAIRALRDWYNNSDKRSRILIKWQSMRFSEELIRNPNESEVDVFRTFLARLMSLQKQLDHICHGDRFLRDRLMTAMDIAPIQIALRDRISRTAQQLANRIANRLSEKPKTVGSAYMSYDPRQGLPQDDETMYTVGQQYGGAARRNIKQYGNKGPSSARLGRQDTHPQNRSERLNPLWMREIKGCFVCGKDHLAKQRHSREEVTTAIERLKAKHPTALLTVEDWSSIYSVMDIEEEEGTCEHYDWVQWAEDNREDDENITLLAMDEGTEIEQVFDLNAFLHGRDIQPSDDVQHHDQQIQHVKQQEPRIHGLRSIRAQTVRQSSALDSITRIAKHLIYRNQ